MMKNKQNGLSKGNTNISCRKMTEDKTKLKILNIKMIKGYQHP